MQGIAAGLILMVCSLVLESCGLDGVRGQISRIDGEYYTLRSASGREIRVHIDENTHKDEVSLGDDVFAYIRKDGYAEFLQRLD